MVLNSVTKRKSISTNQDIKLKIQHLIGHPAPSDYCSKLWPHLSPNFFDMNAKERFDELCALRFNHKFMELLQYHLELSYHFLRKSLDERPELIEELKKNRLGQYIIIPFEIEPYHQRFTDWFGKTVNRLFSSGMYHYLSPNFFTKSPEGRCDELCALRLIPDFLGYLEPNATTYLFLKKSVEDSPELLERLKKTRLGQKYLIPIEFNQGMSQLFTIPVTRECSDAFCKFLSPEYFNKSPKERLIELCHVRGNSGFLRCLGQNKEFADNFLRRSLDNQPELLEQLNLNRLGQHFLIPTEFKEFKEKLLNFIDYEHVEPGFIFGLFKNLSVGFFDKTPSERLIELFDLSRLQGFLLCLQQDRFAANIFLRKSGDESPNLLENMSSVCQTFILPDRKVRKRRYAPLVLRPTMPEYVERKAYIEYLRAKDRRLLSSATPKEESTPSNGLGMNGVK